MIGTVLETSCFLFEIPTGVVADVYSRKLSIIIGLILIGVGFILEGSIPIYIAVLLARVLWGVGYTFLSGADDAWIADEIGEENLDELYLKGSQIGQLLSLIGILFSVVIGTFYLNLPFIIGGALFIGLSIFFIFFMPEYNFEPLMIGEKDSWKNWFNTIHQGFKYIKGSRILITILSISLLQGLYSEGFDRLWDAHMIKSFVFPEIFNFKPIVWFGIINSVAMIFSIFGVEIIKKNLEKNKKLEKVWILTIINSLLVLAIIAFGLAGSFSMALMTYFASYILRTTNAPIFRGWMNQNIKSRSRATIISTIGQADALGQIVGGPIIGYIAYKWAIGIGLVTSGLILSPVIILYLASLRRRINMNRVNN